MNYLTVTDGRPHASVETAELLTNAVRKGLLVMKQRPQKLPGRNQDTWFITVIAYGYTFVYQPERKLEKFLQPTIDAMLLAMQQGDMVFDAVDWTAQDAPRYERQKLASYAAIAP